MITTHETEQIIFSDADLLNSVLVPYKENCHYLQHASLEYQPADTTNPTPDKRKILLLAKGHFSIPYSCYITDTGHFNAAEFNICYNQLAYYVVAACIQHQLIDSLKTWGMETYRRHQLSNMLIVKLSSSFQKPICPDKFEGYLKVKRILKKRNTLFFQTICGFNDGYGGSATGNVLFAIILHSKTPPSDTLSR
jgi:hypothetical protein